MKDGFLRLIEVKLSLGQVEAEFMPLQLPVLLFCCYFYPCPCTLSMRIALNNNNHLLWMSSLENHCPSPNALLTYSIHWVPARTTTG